MSKDWLDSVVLITSSDSAIRDFGTGFAIHREGQKTFILTCAHVVEAVGGSTNIKVDDIQATVIALGSENGIDLAVLCCVGLDKIPFPLGITSEKGNSFTTAGFQRFNNNKELLLRPLRGILGEQVQIGVALTKFVKAWDLKITDDYQLQPGNSGSPIIDVTSNTIVGVVRTRQGDGQKGLAISVEALARIWVGMPFGILSKDILTPSITSNEERQLSISSLIEEFKELLQIIPSINAEKQKLFEKLQTILQQTNIPENILEEIYVEMGITIAKSVLKLWAKDTSSDNDISSSLMDLLKSQTSDIIAQRKGQRQFDIMGERIAESFYPIFRSEGAKLSTGALAATAIAVGHAFNKSNVSRRLLVTYNLEPSKLVHHVLNTNVNIVQYLTIFENPFYERIIQQACEYVIDIASQLPTFNERNFAEILKKEDQILKKTEEILQAVRRIQDLQNSATQSGKFEIDYRLAVIRRLDTLQLFGVTTSVVNRKHRLSPAYINLSVEQRSPFLSKKQIVDTSHITQYYSTIQGQTSKKITKADKALSESQRLLICGVAGTGKTTLLQWIAINSASRSFDGYLTQWNDTIPLYIRLRQFSQTLLPSPQDFPSLISLAIAELMPKGWVHSQLSLGRAIVLIDGLDEIPASRREEVHIWLKDLIENYPKIRVILTSRPHALEEGWLDREEFKYIELQSMELHEIYSFIEHWYKTIKEELRDEDEKSDLDMQLNHFKGIVKYNLSIRNLAANPLLCAMLCALHRDRRQELPTDRIELYEACCESLIERRDKERQILLVDYPILNYRQKRHILEDLAYWMIKNSWSEIGKEDVCERIVWKLKQMHSLSGGISAHAVLKLLTDRSSIIREPAIGRIDFMHRTFQEFLAVKSATDEMDTGLLIANAHNDQWREVIILTAGFATKQMRKQLIQGLIARGNEETENRYRLHLLAVSCLETCIDLEPAVKAEVEHYLAKIIPPKNMADATALASAGELAIKHLVNHEYKYRAYIKAACIRTLALIGGEFALDVLEGYTHTSDSEVIDELFKSWDYFDRATYATRILSQVFQESLEIRLKGLPSLDGLQSFINVKSLSFSNCSQIDDFTPLAALTQLTSLSLSICSNLNDLSSLKDMTQLISLTLYHCPGLKDIDALKGLTQLTSLTICNCPLLSDISSLAYLTQLRILNLLNCTQLNDLTPLTGLTQLTSLDLYRCSKIQDLTPIASLIQLRVLNLACCYEISELAPLTNLQELKSLSLLQCGRIDVLTPLSGLKNLAFLYLSNGFDFAPLRNLKNIVSLYVENCEWLIDLNPLSKCTQLSSLIIKRCNRIYNITPLATLKSLTFLYMSDCANSIDVSFLTSLRNLSVLSLNNCPQISNLNLLKASIQVINRISVFPENISKRVLIIDDRKELLHLMRRVLEDELYQVVTLQDGKEGFLHMKILLPDLLILDLKLGDMSGQDILKQVKNDPLTANIPVLIYTGAVLEAEEVVNLIESDPQFYSGVRLLRKPFELATLLDTIEDMLG